MEGRAHRQHDRAPRAALGGDRDRALDRGLVAADDDLTAAVVVGDVADLALGGGFLATSSATSISAPSSAAIAPIADRHGALHRAAAALQQPRGIRELERMRGGERRIFAERVPGDESDLGF